QFPAAQQAPQSTDGTQRDRGGCGFGRLRVADGKPRRGKAPTCGRGRCQVAAGRLLNAYRAAFSLGCAQNVARFPTSLGMVIGRTATPQTRDHDKIRLKSKLLSSRRGGT